MPVPRRETGDQRRARRIRAGQERIDVPVHLLRTVLVRLDARGEALDAELVLGVATFAALIAD